MSEQSGVLTITLNRPDQLNAMNRRFVSDLRNLFQALYWEPSIRVVVLRASGKAFCAGLDLKEASENQDRQVDTSIMLQRQRTIAEIYVAMRRCPQPIICCIQGAASGGGFALALASDIRLLSEEARMNAAFIRIGLSACDMGVSYFLPRMIGLSRASEYMLTGRFIEAEQALSMGLASRIASAARLDDEAALFAEDMLRATPLGLRLTKDALNHTIDAQGLEAAMALEDRNQMLTAQDPNFHEGIAAFMEKRMPVYG
ncbi:enoyl-CoA hydratase/isomerase family protein [Henriciella aquimarina]|uniref:enoyl-CoA hydratase/isomerase family protein n=1 Tax=Henriciella aquimarina TaxID=545261 RepID=UPI0009FF65C2|nr:enoyl-CoA hydratase/isomerase family protein [Henriciella aquimarina]